MSAVAEELVDTINSFAILKKKDEKIRHFDVKLEFNFEEEWISMTITIR
jgi:hypothetical protein